MSRLIFYAHIAKELSTSPFVCNVGCDQAVATSELLVYIRSVKVFTLRSRGFREEMNVLFERIMSCWEEYVVSDLLSYYARNATTRQTHPGT